MPDRVQDAVWWHVDLDDAPSQQPAPGARDVLAGAGTVQRPGTAAATVALPPHGWAVLGV